MGLSAVAGPQRAATPRTDEFGDPLPTGALSRLGTVRWRHGSPIWFAEFLPDGKSVITLCAEGLATVWEYPTGKVLSQFKVASNTRLGTGAAALTHDGKFLAVSSGGNITIFEIPTGRIVTDSIRAGMTQPSAFAGIAFSPDGKQLAVSHADFAIQLWEWAANKPFRWIDNARPKGISMDLTQTVAFSPDGKTIVYLFREDIEKQHRLKIKFWNAGTADEVRAVSLPTNGEFKFVAFAPAGRTLAVSDDSGSISYIEVATGNLIRKLRGDGPASGALVFSPLSDRLFTLNPNDSKVHEWALSSGKLIRKLDAIETRDWQWIARHQRGISLSRDGQILIAHGVLRHAPYFIDLASGKRSIPKPVPDNPAWGVAFLDGGKRVATRASDASVTYWDPVSGKGLKSFRVAPGIAPVATVSPTGNFVEVLEDIGSISIYAFATGKKVGTSLNADNKPAPPNPGKGVIEKKIARTALPAVVFSPLDDKVILRWPTEQKIEVLAMPSGKRLHEFAVSTVAKEPKPGF
jgi:WD40 repeat protein